MNESLALHTAARRYCLDQHAYWCERYSEIVHKRTHRQDGHYTPEALRTYPRNNVLNAIRVEIERMDPTDLDNVEGTRALLVLAGETADNDFTRQPIGEIDARAMTEEREAFCRFIAGAQIPDLIKMEGLPFRRVLSAAESQSIWSRLRGRWQIPEGYWYPLTESNLSDIVAFKTRSFDEAVATERLRIIFAARGIERVWELREYGPEYEEDLTLFLPYYNGAEGYWSSGDMAWIIYASHESSVTIGGWLLQDVKAIWPSWQSHVWPGVLGE